MGYMLSRPACQLCRTAWGGPGLALFR